MQPKTFDFGPVQLLSVAFDGNHFKGELLPELERLKADGMIRIIDLLFVRKDSVGGVAKLTASDLDWEEATRFGAFIGTLVGFGAGGPEGAERGAIAGAAELSDGHLFDEHDAWRLTESVPPNTSVALLLLEHTWALPLMRAIDRADGFQVSNDWVRLEDLVALGIHHAAETVGDE